MADKIASFEEYKNKEAARQDRKQDISVEQTAKDRESSDEKTPSVKAPVSQETMNIQIEDPFKFLDEEEREEYLLERQREKREELKRDAIEKAQEIKVESPIDSNKTGKEKVPEEVAADQHIAKKEEHKKRNETPEERLRRRHSERIREDFTKDSGIDHENEETTDEVESEEYQEGADSGKGVNMELVVRIASVLTGIVILLVVGMLVKTKIYDRYIAADPDEAAVTVAAFPAGYIEKNDIVVVSGASSLNLRSVPSAESSETVVDIISEGTELNRIAVSESGDWALIDYNGQRVYCSMKYLVEKQ